MTRHRFRGELPDDAARYLGTMRNLDAPIDLVDSIMAEVEATPQETAWWPRLPVALAAAAAALLAVALLFRFGGPPVGPQPTPIPVDDLPSAGSIVNRVTLDRDDVPVGIAAAAVWLANSRTGELVDINPATGALVGSPITVTEARDADSLPVAFAAASVWAFDGAAGELVEIDPRSGEERRRIRVDVSVEAMTAGDGAVWLISAADDALVRVQAGSGDIGPTIDVTDPTAIAVGEGVVWIAHDGRRLSRLDPADGSVQVEVDIGAEAGQLEVVGSSVSAVPVGGGPLIRVDASTLAVETGTAVRTVAADGEVVWAILPSGHVARLGDDLQPVAAMTTGSMPLGLVVGVGAVWTAGLDEQGAPALIQIEPAQ